MAAITKGTKYGNKESNMGAKTNKANSFINDTTLVNVKQTKNSYFRTLYISCIKHTTIPNYTHPPKNSLADNVGRSYKKIKIIKKKDNRRLTMNYFLCDLFNTELHM